MIPIFLSSDNNYAPYLAVAIKSICENTKNAINFYIIDCGIEESIKNILTKLVLQYTGNTIEFIDPSEQNIFNDCRARNHVSKAAYARLLIPYIKPQIDKVVYLDVDIIVNLDITELFNQNINDYIIGAPFGECEEYYYHGIRTKKSLGIDMIHNYFCSGILVIDCKKWRENNLTQKLKDIYEEYKERMIHNDQDLLNILFSNNKYFNLDKKFNYIIQYEHTENPNVIYHYDGAVKPWHFLPSLKTNIIKYIDIWWDYAKKTPFYDELLKQCKYKTKESLYDKKLEIFLWKHNRFLKNKIKFIKKVLNLPSFKQSNKERKIYYLNTMIYSLLDLYQIINIKDKIFGYIQILLFTNYLQKAIQKDILDDCYEYKRLPSLKKLLKRVISVENIYRKSVKHKVFNILGIKLKIKINKEKNGKSISNNSCV